MNTRIIIHSIFLLQCLYFKTTICWSAETVSLEEYHNSGLKDIYDDYEDDSSEQTTTATRETEEPQTDSNSEEHTTTHFTTGKIIS